MTRAIYRYDGVPLTLSAIRWTIYILQPHELETTGGGIAMAGLRLA
jgi:hypothetical protein